MSVAVFKVTYCIVLIVWVAKLRKWSYLAPMSPKKLGRDGVLYPLGGQLHDIFL